MVKFHRVVWRVLAAAVAAAFATPAFAQPAGETAIPVDSAPAVEPLQVQALRAGLSVVQGAGANVVVWAGPDGIALVDSGLAERAAELFETVARIAPGPLRLVIATHGHPDHTGGNAVAVARGAVLIGHERLREAEPLEPAADAATPAPMVTTADALSVHLNGERLDLVHVADAHTSSDLVARWAQADVVALGGLFRNGQYPRVDLDAGGSFAGTVAAIESVLARAHARTLIVPGHGPVATRAELAEYRDMLVAVGRRVREAVERGESLETLQATRPTAAFDARYAHPGASVAPAEFVATVYEELTRRR